MNNVFERFWISLSWFCISSTYWTFRKLPDVPIYMLCPKNPCFRSSIRELLDSFGPFHAVPCFLGPENTAEFNLELSKAQAMLHRESAVDFCHKLSCIAWLHRFQSWHRFLNSIVTGRCGLGFTAWPLCIRFASDPFWANGPFGEVNATVGNGNALQNWKQTVPNFL